MPLDWKVISQRNWLKGLQATFSRFAQPQAIITRLSNMLYDKRGGLRTSDGSFVFAQQGSGTAQGSILDIALYSPTGVAPYYVDIQANINAGEVVFPTVTATAKAVGGTITTAVSTAGRATITLSAPHGLIPNTELDGNLIQAGNSNPLFNVTVEYAFVNIGSPTSYSYPEATAGSGTGGTVKTSMPASAALEYSVTSVDAQGGETPSPSTATVNLTGGQNAATVAWTTVPGTFGYYVYGRTAGALVRLTPSPVQSPYLDIGGNANGPPMPTQNTAQQLQTFTLQPPNGSTVIGTFPSFIAPPLGGIPGAPTGTNAVSGAATPAGGIEGATSPLPQLVQFANLEIMALGNGYPPQEYADGTAAVIAVPNNFNAEYTDWQPSVSWNAGDQIRDSVSGGIFSAQQGGVSAATRPAFNDTLNALTPEITPGTVVWICTAISAVGTPLRGAACALVYAGSLWLANTWPVTTDDFLDGPNCLKMSNVNDPTNWNPVNVAFLSKDDGDQITCLATYTIAESGISPTGSLVIFKNFSTFQLTGVFGAPDLTIQQAQTDLGNVAPRSATFIPGYGIARLTHVGFAYFNGVNDKDISEEIRPYLFGGQSDIMPIDWNYAYLSKGTQAANPPMYVCACPIKVPVLGGVTITGSGSSFPIYARVIKQTLDQYGNWVNSASTSEVEVFYDSIPQINVVTPSDQSGVRYIASAGYIQNGENQLLTGTTFNGVLLLSQFTPGFNSYGSGGLQRIFCYDLVSKAWAIIDVPFLISSLKQIRSPGTVPITVACGSNDGSTRRLFAGDEDWDNGEPVTWSLTGAELFQQGGSAKIYYRRLVLRGSGNIGGSVNVTLQLQGNNKPAGKYPVFQLGGDQWEVRVDICRDAANSNATISGSGSAQVVMESMDWYVKPKASGIPTSIQK